MALKISREFKVGIYIVVAIALLYWGINFLKGNDVFADGTVYYAVYNNTEGLTKAKAVQINGYQVGLIDEIYFHPDRSGRLIIKMTMTEDYPLPANTLATIHSIGFLGEKAIELKLGDSKEFAQNGDTLASGSESSLSEEVSEQVAPIKAKAEQLLGSLDTVVMLVSGYLTEDTRANFSQTFENLRTTFENLENTSALVNAYMIENSSRFTQLAKNLESISNTLASNDKNITAVLSNLNSITDSLKRADVAKTLADVDHAVVQLDEIITKINQGQGTMGELINNKVLYENLTNASSSLDRLLLDIKYNPNKYFNVSLFGNQRYYSEEEIRQIEKELKERENQQNK